MRRVRASSLPLKALSTSRTLRSPSDQPVSTPSRLASPSLFLSSSLELGSSCSEPRRRVDDSEQARDSLLRPSSLSPARPWERMLGTSARRREERGRFGVLDGEGGLARNTFTPQRPGSRDHPQVRSSLSRTLGKERGWLVLTGPLIHQNLNARILSSASHRLSSIWRR